MSNLWWSQSNIATLTATTQALSSTEAIIHLNSNNRLEVYTTASTQTVAWQSDTTIFNGGVVTGETTFTNGVTANTISASTYYGDGSNLTGIQSTGSYVSSFTYLNNIFTITQSGRSDLSVVLDSVTALTIQNNISFNTGSTVYGVAGTLYFDENENALSYKPFTVNNDVTINIGQENLIKVYNNTGQQINNGEVCHINGSIDGTPTITLATGSVITDDSEISGVATHNILVNDYGFITSFGIVRDLTITGTTAGTTIYLSDKIVGGYEYSLSGLSINSRVNKIGRVVTTGVTTAKILVDINNENIQLSLTDRQRNITNGNVISTGVYEYMGATTASTTTINIASVSGWLVKNTYSNATNPTIISVIYTGETNVAIENILTSDSTYIMINSSSTIYQQSTFPTPQQRRENIFLGKINHPNRSTILNINNIVDYDISPMSALRDMFVPMKLINDGITAYANGSNLTFNTTAGKLYGMGINWVNNQLNPNEVDIFAKIPTTFFYRTQTGGTSTAVTSIDTNVYDLGGNITTIPSSGDGGSNRTTNQRIYIYPTGIINIQYGQKVYDTLALALAGQQTETFIRSTNIATTAILIGLLAVRRGTTNLSDTSRAIFTPASMFGESVGGVNGISTTTLQQAYDNSIQPEIVINSTLDGLSIKNGTGNANSSTTLLEGINDSNIITSYIKADGNSLFSSVSASTYYGDGANLLNLTTSSQFNTYTGVTAPTLYLPYIISTETHFTTGHLNKLESVISYDSSTTVFTISPTGDTFTVYLDGEKFEKTSQSFVMSAVTNFQPNKLFFIYFNSTACTLFASSTPWDILSRTAPTATLYCNGTQCIIGDERHNANRNLSWHKWAHETLGSQYKSGLDATFTSATTLISSGVIEDEDIVINITPQTQLRIWITDISGTATTFLNEISEISAYVSGSTLMWDNGGIHTTVSTGYYVKNFIYATNDIDYPIAVIIGQQQYSNINDARNSIFPTFPTYISAETRLLYTTIWQNNSGVTTFIESSDFRTAKTAPNGVLGKRPLYIGELEDVITTTPSVDDTLRFNGVNWITGPTPTSAGAGVSFYYATPILTGRTASNSNPILTLSKTPVTTTEQITATTIAITGSLIMSAWLYDTALSKTIIDAGSWDFNTYAGVDNAGGGRVSTITHGIYSVLPTGITIYTSGTGASRTVTALSGSPFSVTNISASTINTVASYLQTPKGLYQISVRTSDSGITILTPTTYVNETATTFNTWKRLFNVVTPTIAAISPAYALYTTKSTQGSFTITPESKIGTVSFATSNNTTSRVITMAYNGTARNSYFTTPLVITHNQLANLQGGVQDEYYHLSLSELQLAQIAVPNTRTINNYALSSNITLSFGDLSSTAHTHSEYVSKDGDVMVGSLQLPHLTATTLSATTLYLSNRLTVSGDSYINGLTVGLGGGNQVTNIAFGKEALYGNSTGTGNVMIGYRAGYVLKTSNNIAIGYESMRFSNNANVNANLAIGYRTLYSSLSGGSNIALGYYSLYSSTGNSNIAIGPNSGRYATSSNELYIDNVDRTTNENEKSQAIMYGVMAALPSAQTLYINAKTVIGGNYSLPTTTGSTGQLLTSSGATTYWSSPKLAIQLAVSDETTPLTTGTTKISFRMPFAMTLTEIRASLVTAQTTGNTFTIDINKSGVTILSTKLTINNTHKTSKTATIPVVISDTNLPDDIEMTVDIDQIGNSTAKGLKISLIGV